MKWTANRVREAFIKYFKDRGHVVVPSSSLLPYGDPTLLFTNAGMNQFKDYFLGKKEPPFRRATSSQKCMRAGGKHNDLDNVGFTKRHHTFFEMLGNFSFGDYFKREAINFAWELLTEVYGLPREKLWISVYRDDDEAYSIWKDEIGVPESRIVRLGEKDNFWEMGDTGPCGPSSEIHYDLGETEDSNQKNPGEEGERFLELWNLVFMQYHRDENGNLHPLPKKNIDTGMGLERILRVLQGADSNFHTDLFMPIIEEIERIVGLKYSRGDDGAPFRVLADHSRALTMAIADGIYPSNYGRGYVLRRILRRAHRFAQKIGYEDRPILYRLVPIVVDVMKDTYPELVEKKAEIEIIVKKEEERFIENIARTLPKLREEFEKAKDSGVLPGSVVFTFYDTYGLPIDLIEEYAKTYNIDIDFEEFHSLMSKQRERARSKKVSTFEVTEWKTLSDDRTSEFIGYETLNAISKLIKYARGEEKAYLVFEKTPFYAESGGQVSDKGYVEFEINGEKYRFSVIDVQKSMGEIVHVVKGDLPDIEEPVECVLVVDEKYRKGSMRAHTATHLLHAALREVLGMHVRQEGSLVEPDRLRFDFLHFKAMTQDELREVERIVNEKIQDNIELEFRYMKYHDALRMGAMALFEGKYGETVRVVKIGNFSIELCGGTHVNRTGDIGLFKIIKEEASSSNIRRIEAYTGERAVDFIQKESNVVGLIESLLGGDLEILPQRVKKLQDELKKKEEEIDRIYGKMASFVRDSLSIKVFQGIEVLTGEFEGVDIRFLRKLMDAVKAIKKDGKYLLILAALHEGSFNILIYSNVDSLNAVSILKKMSPYIKGGGGGNNKKAEGGGKDLAGLRKVINNIEMILKEEG